MTSFHSHVMQNSGEVKAERCSSSHEAVEGGGERSTSRRIGWLDADLLFRVIENRVNRKWPSGTSLVNSDASGSSLCVYLEVQMQMVLSLGLC